MVQWKGNLEENVGNRAENLDELEGFNVPNFFVITSGEVKELFSDTKGKDQVLNSQVKGEVRNEIKNAYEDIGVSSEVRNAVGKAKSLVGGQRSNPRVSIRVSEINPGEYSNELNVGASSLFESIKNVVSSYYEKEGEYPPVIIQKMVEPEYTGAAVPDYGDNGLVEIVEGLGSALDKGSERPHFYLIGRRGIVEKDINREQVRVERNPINGEKERKSSGNFEIDDSEIKELYGKIASKDINVKFVYKRGSFHIVDVWRSDRRQKQEKRRINRLNGIKIGDGTASGKIGEEIKFTEKPISPDKYRSLITKKGGYTSSNIQKARNHGKIVVAGYKGELEDGTKVEINDEEIVEKKDTVGEGNQIIRGDEKPRDNENLREDKKSGNLQVSNVCGSDMLPLNPNRGDGVYTGNAFGQNFRIVINGETRQVKDEERVESYREAFEFNEDYLILDLRDIELGSEVLDYLQAEQKVVIVERPSVELIRKALENGVRKFVASDNRMKIVQEKVGRAEKKILLDHALEGSK